MSSILNVYNKQQFNADVSFNSNASFNNTTTQISSSEVGISGGVINMSSYTFPVLYASGDTKLSSRNGYTTFINNDKTSGHLYINATSTSSNMIVENGNVGIGKTNPAYKLDVSGTANFSGATTLGGTLTLSNNGSVYCGSGAVNCGTLGCTSINTNNGTVSVGSGAVNCGAVTCGAVTCSTLTTGRNTITSGSINCYDINTNNYNVTCGSGAVTCGAVSCSTLTTGRNTITSGSINCYDINTNSYSINVGTGAVNWGNSVSILKSNGYIGIGDTNPTYPLTIGYSNSKWIGYYMFANQNSLGMNAALYATENISLHCANGGYFTNKVFASHFATESDSRIKNNIVDIDDSKALTILRQIQPKTYEYIDKLKRGNENVIGFIAQEIQAILPKAVSIIKTYIPNFYTNCQVAPTDVPNIVLVTSPIDLSWNPLHGSDGSAFIDAEGNACSDASGKKEFNVKLYDQSNNEIKCKTTSILDKRSFLMDISGSNVTNVMQGDYFLHGQEVDDFHNIDKSAIFTVVTAAVQDIDRIVQADAAKIAALEQQVASQDARIAALEQAIAALQGA